jgi:Ca2+-binding RTX toxin-like protein
MMLPFLRGSSRSRGRRKRNRSLRSRRTYPDSQRSRHLSIEPLEERQLLSVTPALEDNDTAALFGGDGAGADLNDAAFGRNRQVVFVDPSVADSETLLGGLLSGSEPDTRVAYLDAGRDGVEQITEVLARCTDVSAVQVFSHGSSGSLTLGSTHLGADNLDAYASQLGLWGITLSETADILLYGCNVAQGDFGVAFVNRLAELTGADVAASDDLTGAAALGGDWDLEVAAGAINVAQVFDATSAADFSQVLERIDVTKDGLSAPPTPKDDVYRFQSGWVTITIDKNVPVPNPEKKDPAPMAQSGGEDTFDFNAIGQPVRIVVGKSHTTAKQGIHEATATGKFRPYDVTGGTADDVFVIQKSASLAGMLDGHTGVDVLSYSDPQLPFAGKVRVNLAWEKEETNPVTKEKAALVASSATNVGSGRLNGINHIEIVIGGKRHDVLFGLEDGNKLAGGLGDDFIVGGPDADLLVGGGKGDAEYIGALRDANLPNISEARTSSLEATASGGLFSSDNDTLVGKAGNDLLIGAKGDDHLFGGPGNDRLYGGPGDDTYYFEDNWEVDTLDDSEGKHTLDFSKVTKRLTHLIGLDGKLTITDGVNKLENIDPDMVEWFTGGGGYDEVKVRALPIPLLRYAGGLELLDLSAYQEDLEVTIGGDVANKVTVKVQGQEKPRIIAYGVVDLIGGLGNNTYKSSKGGR